MPALLLAALSAILVSLSRLPLHCGWLVFLAWIPLLHVLQQKELKLWQIALAFTPIQIGVVFSWIWLVTPGGLIGIGVIFFLFYLLAFYAIRRIANAYPRLRYVGFVLVLLSFEFLQNICSSDF